MVSSVCVARGGKLYLSLINLVCLLCEIFVTINVCWFCVRKKDL